MEVATDAESPMVGVISGVRNSKQGRWSFKWRLVEALQDHFDASEIIIVDLPNIFDGDLWWDIEISTYEQKYTIRILETWLY